MHLGQLHAYEAALLALLAFGPFVVLAVVVGLMRRRDAEDERRDGEVERAGATAEEQLSDER